MRITDDLRLSWGEALREALGGLSDLHSIVAERTERQKRLDETLAQAAERVGREETEESDALEALQKASEDALRRARLVALKLETAKLEAGLEHDVFNAVMNAAYPRGVGQIGGSAGERHRALEHIAGALVEHPDVDGDGALRKLATEGMQMLTDANEAAKKEAAEKKEAHEQLIEARTAWDDGYEATKNILSGILLDAGRREELPDVFPDLSSGRGR